VLTTGIYVVSYNRRWRMVGASLGSIAFFMWLNLALPQIELFGLMWIIAQLFSMGL
jgi:hypothetical protein